MILAWLYGQPDSLRLLEQMVKTQLDESFKMVEEAKRRDHRKIGQGNGAVRD